MRRIAIVNQKGGVGKTTTAANLGAALARRGRKVVLVDLDPQGNLSTHLDVEVEDEGPSSYGVLCDGEPFGGALRATSTEGLFVVPADIDLSGAEMELAAAIGRESILRDSIDAWEEGAPETFDYIIFDCPPSLGLLSINGLVAAREVFITLQTEFFALKGMSKLVEIVQLLKRRLNPELEISGIIPCLYDSRLRLAREVLAEIRRYFPGPVFRRSIRTNVKLAEAPSHGVSIFEYAPESAGASDYLELADEVLAQEVGSPVASTEVHEAAASDQPEEARADDAEAKTAVPAVEPAVDQVAPTVQAVESDATTPDPTPVPVEMHPTATEAASTEADEQAPVPSAESEPSPAENDTIATQPVAITPVVATPVEAAPPEVAVVEVARDEPTPLEEPVATDNHVEATPSEPAPAVAKEEPLPVVELQVHPPVQLEPSQPNQAEEQAPEVEVAAAAPALEVPAATVDAPLDDAEQQPHEVTAEELPTSGSAEDADDAQHPGGGTGRPSRPHFERRAPNLDKLPRAEDLPPLPEEAFRTFEP